MRALSDPIRAGIDAFTTIKADQRADDQNQRAQADEARKISQQARENSRQDVMDARTK